MFGRSHAGSVAAIAQVPQEVAGHLRRSAPRGRRGTVGDRHVDLGAAPRRRRRGTRPAGARRGRGPPRAPRPVFARRWARRRARAAAGPPWSAALRPWRATALVDREVRVARARRRLPVPDHVQLGVDAAHACRTPACCRSSRACRSSPRGARLAGKSRLAGDALEVGLRDHRRPALRRRAPSRPAVVERLLRGTASTARGRPGACRCRSAPRPARRRRRTRPGGCSARRRPLFMRWCTLSM